LAQLIPAHADLQRVAVLAPLSWSYAREAVLGVSRFARAFARWSIRVEDATVDAAERVVRLRPDGVVAHLSGDAMRRVLSAAGIPLVNTSGVLPGDGTPRVVPDNRAVGRLAAEHLLGRGFRRLAWTGLRQAVYAQERKAGFVDAAVVAGVEVTQAPITFWHDAESDAAAAAEQQTIFRRWCDALLGPTGLFVSNDELAVRFTDGCLRCGVRVPDDLAILGADDDEVLCETSYPPLSSVQVPAEQVGYEAARVLAALIDGRPAPPGPVLVPPAAVRTRQSTDVLAVADAEVAAALRHIRQHAEAGVDIDAMVDAMPISRRALEIRFKRHVGHTILEEVHRRRLDRAKRLLAETDLSVLEVAVRCGYTETQRLSEAFRRYEGESPTGYRRRLRLDDAT